MKTRRVLAIILISVMALGSTACRARERYLREHEADLASRPIRCNLDYGRFDLPPGWEELSPGSYEQTGDDEYYSYHLTVSYDTNDYSGDDRYYFQNDGEELVRQEFPDAEIDVLLRGGISDDAAGEYLIADGDTYIVRWYRVRAGDQVMFELTTPDATVTDSEAMEQIDHAVNSFHWN